MIKKIFLFCIILILITLISGCEGFDFSFGGEAEFNPDIHVGSEGLVMNMLQNSPPDELYEDEDFKIVVRLVNKGAYGINNGVILLNYEKEFMELQGERTRHINLEEKTIYNAWDDEKVESFNMKTKLLDKMSRVHTSIISLITCYDYETIAGFEACIDTNYYETRPEENKICVVRDQTSSGQGGPIVITRVEQDISGGEYIIPQFKIHIKNMGEGNVVRYGKKEEACSSTGIDTKDYNVVDVVDVTLSNYKMSAGEIKCSPDEVKLKDGEALLRCYLTENKIKNTDSSFLTSLRIHLRYGYTQIEAKYVDILDDLSKEGRDISISTPSSSDNWGTKQSYHCEYPYENSYCYDLSNDRICPRGLEDIKGKCPGPVYIRCCALTNVPKETY